jgi:hypothetical protein
MVSLLGLSSCKKITDPEFCSTAWAIQISDELTALSNAAIVYSNNPTVQNCLSYKAAYQAYIDALEPFGDCASWSAQQKADWQDEIDDAQEEINGMTCS